MATAIPPNTTVNIYPTPEADRGLLDNFQGSTNAVGANSPTPTHRIAPRLNGSNANVALCPKGTGAFLADMPDNTAAGGNARGTNAVDLQTVRTSADQVAAGIGSVLAGGWNNKIGTTATSSVISGGYFNSVIGVGGAVIAGGNSNSIQGSLGVIGGGSGNLNLGVAAVIGGGQSNTLLSTLSGGFIGGGGSNTIAANVSYPTIVGGYSNQLIDGASWAFLGGGSSNTISNEYSFLGGGTNNSTHGSHSVLGGGFENIIGTFQTPGGSSAVLVGGYGNGVYGDFAALVGGAFNTLSGLFASLVGGTANALSGEYGFLGGGTDNDNRGAHAVIVGGRFNLIEAGADRAAIVGGENNTVTASGAYAGVLPGTHRVISERAGEIVRGLGGGYPRDLLGTMDYVGQAQNGVVHRTCQTSGSDSQYFTVPITGLTGDRPTFPIRNGNEAYLVRVRVFTATDTAFWYSNDIVAMVRRNLAGTVSVTLITSPSPTLLGSGALFTYGGSITVSLTANNAYKGFDVVVGTPAFVGVLHWTCEIEYLKMTPV